MFCRKSKVRQVVERRETLHLEERKEKMTHIPRSLMLIYSFNKYLSSTHLFRVPLWRKQIKVPVLKKLILACAYASTIIILYLPLPDPVILHLMVLLCFTTVGIWGKRIFWCLHRRGGDGWKEKLFRKER